LVRANSSLGSSRITRLPSAVHSRCACGICLAFTPHGCWQCRLLSCRQDEPSIEKYVVPEASYPTVTHRACPGRQLLVVQQVTASTSNVPIAECDKARKSFAVYYLCRFTSGLRRHVSHSPRSLTRATNSSPCGLPATSRNSAKLAVNRAYHVPSLADPHTGGPIRLAPVYSPMTSMTTCLQCEQKQPAIYHFGQSPCSSLSSFDLTRIPSTVHLRCACGTCLAPTPRGCWQCRLLPCRQGEPSSEGYFVPGASNPIVTSRARPGRQLLVVQQVTASTSAIPVVECDKARKSFAIYYMSHNVRLTATRVALTPDRYQSSMHR